MRNTLLSAAVLLVAGTGLALAAPRPTPPGMPTVSAGPMLAQPVAGSPLAAQTPPFQGYGGYRIGPDGQFHGYGVYAPGRNTGRQAPRGPGASYTPASTDAAVAANGEVLASSIIANQYAPIYGVPHGGYGGIGY